MTGDRVSRTILFRLRRDLRLADHPGLAEAAASGRPVVPVFILDGAVAALGAAPRFRLGLGLEDFARRLEGIGSRLVLRRGEPGEVLTALARETGAGAVWWQREHEPATRAADAELAATLQAAGLETRDFPGQLLFDPGTVATKTGGPYKVYTPFWKAIRDRDPGPALPEVAALRPPEAWPPGERLADWRLGAAMDRGAAVVARHVRVGEAKARARLSDFTAGALARYESDRDIPGVEGTSGLSEPLTYGEISPRACWHAGMAALEQGSAGAGTWLKELAWREFAWHLLHHTPRLGTGNWRPDWDGFPWRGDEEAPAVLAWKQGRTGVELVDAAMREMWVTGRMHNRARMVAASFLTKHLLVDWRVGQRFFAACLTDWDPASNALGWQWVAGSGPDAAPFFRVFNPDGQRDRFDRDRRYVHRWIAEGQAAPPESALAFFEAVPRAWGLSPSDAYPDPVVDLAEGRARALEAYRQRRG